MGNPILPQRERDANETRKKVFGAVKDRRRGGKEEEEEERVVPQSQRWCKTMDLAQRAVAAEKAPPGRGHSRNQPSLRPLT